jgi:hypothetical protein
MNQHITLYHRVIVILAHYLPDAVQPLSVYKLRIFLELHEGWSRGREGLGGLCLSPEYCLRFFMLNQCILGQLFL